MLRIEPTNSCPKKPYEVQKPPERVMTRTNKNDRIQNLTNPLPIKRNEEKEEKRCTYPESEREKKKKGLNSN